MSRQCSSKITSRIFNGSDLYYSYDVCGQAPDCYNHMDQPRCPYDPSGTESYAVHKGNGCECLYHGANLPQGVYTEFPLHHPGMHENLDLQSDIITVGLFLLFLFVFMLCCCCCRCRRRRRCCGCCGGGDGGGMGWCSSLLCCGRPRGWHWSWPSL